MGPIKPCFHNTLNGIKHPMLVNKTRVEGRKTSFFSKTKTKTKKKMICELDSLKEPWDKIKSGIWIGVDHKYGK